MCGFVGYIKNHENERNTQETEHIKAMTDVITHRGPDEEGYYSDEIVSFGFRRLSIIDLENGKQPLSFENHRFWIVFNGEIYNYVELRNELQKTGVEFTTSSDTEVILALYSREREKAVYQLRGMFAFVIWDKENKELFAARDMFGIKPFFYLEEDDRVYFSSEKKSFLHEKQRDSVNQEALHHYLTYQYVPEPLTMSDGIKKLEPGHFLRKKIGQPIKIKKYYDVHFNPFIQPTEQLTKQVRDTLRDSVKIHMRSDVPVGAFLSGGIDSTSIVAFAKEFNPDIKTFTVGFEREGYSEIDLAKDTADQLGVDNTHYIVSPQEFIEELPKIIWHMDDPVADPSAVPLYFVAKEASKHVKVVLSGEGADELFGGYNIYREPQSLKWFSYLPQEGKQLLRSLANRLPDGLKGKSFIERGCTPIQERYFGNAKIYTEAEKRVLLKKYHPELNYQRVTNSLYEKAKHYHDVHKMQYVDMFTWLRGDILVKADRMTMAHSLELRVPFLDKEVFKVASTIDPSLSVSNQTTKYILRKAVDGIIPDNALNRKKLGFPVPIRHWLRNELYDWAIQLIRSSKTEYLFHKENILKQLEDHRKGKYDFSRKLWVILVFMVWHGIFVENNNSINKELQAV